MALQAMSSVTSAPAPQMRADLRPTADTAALVRNPRPNIPLPVPASFSQKSAVTQAQIASPSADVTPLQRVLKPYGVVMLPQGATQQPSKKSDSAETTVAKDESATTDAPQAKAAATVTATDDNLPVDESTEADTPVPENDDATT